MTKAARERQEYAESARWEAAKRAASDEIVGGVRINRAKGRRASDAR